MKTSNKSGKRRFLGLADRDDQEWFQERTGLCKNSVLAAIRGLERAGAISVKRATGISSSYDLTPLMSLPERENRFTTRTGSPDERVHEMHPTGSSDAPPPVHLVNPKDPNRRNPGATRHPHGATDRQDDGAGWESSTTKDLIACARRRVEARQGRERFRR
ncbi:MAG TPA: hypothetical protein VMI54_19925, partial [Polyangiaceae bacterium]|nr:hypothetical protein [Polyangiaceae bacterium]